MLPTFGHPKTCTSCGDHMTAAMRAMAAPRLWPVKIVGAAMCSRLAAISSRTCANLHEGAGETPVHPPAAREAGLHVAQIRNEITDLLGAAKGEDREMAVCPENRLGAVSIELFDQAEPQVFQDGVVFVGELRDAGAQMREAHCSLVNRLTPT